MTIIGIDPGSRFTGFGVLQFENDRLRHLEHGVITISIDRPFAERLSFLARELEPLFARWPQAVTVVERIFLGKNADSAFKLGHARGVCLALAAMHGSSVVEYAPRSVKKAVTGSGAADKVQVQRAVEQVLRIQTQMKVDASDALALAICHSQTLELERRLGRLKEYQP